MGLFDFLKHLFSSNYVLLHTAIGDEECMKVIGKLHDARIPHKTKIRGIYAGREKRSLGFTTKLSQYDIYVKKEDEYRGYQVIHYGN